MNVFLSYPEKESFTIIKINNLLDSYLIMFAFLYSFKYMC